MGMCRRCAGHSRGAAHCSHSVLAGRCLLLPFPAHTSISPSASSTICFTFPSLSWDNFCSEKEKEGGRAWSEAWRKGSHRGLREGFRLHLCLTFTQVFAGAVQGRTALLGVAGGVKIG